MKSKVLIGTLLLLFLFPFAASAQIPSVDCTNINFTADTFYVSPTQNTMVDTLFYTDPNFVIYPISCLTLDDTSIVKFVGSPGWIECYFYSFFSPSIPGGNELPSNFSFNFKTTSFTPGTTVSATYNITATGAPDGSGADCDCSYPITLVLGDPPSCTAPTSPSSSVDAFGNVSLTWLGWPDHQGWQLSGGPVGGPARTRVSFSNSLSINRLPGGNYAWKVRAKCTDGSISAFSGVDNFAVSGLRASNALGPVVVSPNPVSSFVELSADGYDLAVLVDISGRTLANVPLEDGLGSLDLSDYTPGLYFIVFSGPDGSSTKKLYLD